MGNCPAFTVKVKDVKKSIDKAKAAIKKDGGTFTGDEEFYGTSILRNALALATAMNIEDGDSRM